MKSKKSPTLCLSLSLLIPLIVILASGRPAHAQDGADAPKPIHVTETLHSDGTRTVMTTNPDDHSAESQTFNQANKLLERIVYVLDEQGQATGATGYSPKGKALYKLTYKRDEQNRVNEVDTFTVNDILVSKTVYHYAQGGKVIGVDTYDANGNQISASTAPPPGGGATPPKRRGYPTPRQ